MWGSVKHAINALYDKTLYRLLLEERFKKETFRGMALDVGSRNRRYDSVLSACDRVVAVDLKPNAAKGVMACSAVALAFKDNTFDTVICIEVIHYIEDFKSALSEMKRVLKPGGKLIVTVPFLARMCQDYDSLRLTAPYWERVLAEEGFEVDVRKWGGRWGVAFDAVFDKFRHARKLWKIVFAPACFVFRAIARWLDGFEKDDPFYAMGYFISLRKLGSCKFQMGK